MASVAMLFVGAIANYFLRERVPAPPPAPATTASLRFKKKTNFDSKLVSKQINEKRSKGHEDDAMSTSAYSLDHAFDIDDDPDRN
ncbi:hypothetical protein DCAR_0727602 [Daucus carota subsp. sativus]|uniref:Uncharacterized protein n=1 Tax=Daucus carota subsp. sativus TaxID=79200 RepID=A0A164T1S1_DAUCS|nr:hypothetical protein DCAR_0727602 [Daucus carota subsp. sativus]